MLDGMFRSNFRTKCKSCLNRTKTRLELIKKRRNTIQKIVKEDIANLLKSNLESNAYGRVEGLYMDLILSSCYEFVEQYCACIAENLKEMHKQSDCPEQCRVAVASLIYAAARFADLPELRDLRSQFYEKYGKSMETFVNKEFMENLKSRPPSIEMKLHLMQTIAKEFSLTWDPSQLVQQLQSPCLPTKEKLANIAPENGASVDGRHLFRNKTTLVQGKGKQVEEDRQDNEGETLAARSARRRTNSYSGFKEYFADETQEENIANNRKPFTNKIVPAPYIRTNHNYVENEHNTKEDTNHKLEDNNDSVSKAKPKPRPRSVRTKFLMPSASTSSATSSSEFENDPRENLSARVTRARPRHELLSDEDEEEGKMDSVFTQFGRKTAAETPRKDENNNGTPKMSELPPPPGRRRYLFPESPPASPVMESADSFRKSERSRFLPPDQQQFDSVKAPIRHVKSTSYANDGYQVHPRMPDFDELAERISALKNQ